MSTGFKTFENAEKSAWARDGAEFFVGHGTVTVNIARSKMHSRFPYLQFRFKGRLISRDRARAMFDKWSRDCEATHPSGGDRHGE